MPGMPVKTSGYPANGDYVAPTLGEHNEDVLTNLLGKSADDVATLTDSGVLQSGAT